MFPNAKAWILHCQSLIERMQRAKSILESNEVWLEFVRATNEAKFALEQESDDCKDKGVSNAADIDAMHCRMLVWLNQIETEFLKTKSD